MALRIQALSNSGRAAKARSLADEFQGKYPTHPLLREVSGKTSLKHVLTARSAPTWAQGGAAT